MQNKDDLLRYCNYVKRNLDMAVTDKMYHVFMPWLKVLPEKNYGLVNTDNIMGQSYLLSFMPDVEIGFTIPTIIEKLVKNELNVSRHFIESERSIIYSNEENAPYKDDYTSILAVDFPKSSSQLKLLKPYIIDGNKRISQAVRRGHVASVTYNLIEPHSFDPFCFTDIYSRFILLFTYDMAIVSESHDPQYVLSTVQRVISRFSSGYPSLMEFLKNSASLL